MRERYTVSHNFEHPQSLPQIRSDSTCIAAGRASIEQSGMLATAFLKASLAHKVGSASDDISSGKWAEAIAKLRRLHRTALQQNDAELAEVVCQNLAVACRETGDLTIAQSWQQQSIAWWARRASVDRGREDDELARLACDLTGRGCDEFVRCNFDLAETLWRRALAIEEWRGSWEAQAIDCGNLGLLAAARGELEEGVRWLRKSLRLHRLMFDERGAGTDLLNLAELLRLLGDFRRSKNALQRAIRCFERIGAEPLREQALRRYQEAKRIEAVLQFDPSLN